MKSFEYASPKNLKEATALLSDRWGETEVLAGGTDLTTCLKQGLTEPNRVVSLKNIKALRGIDAKRGGVRIGATTPLGEIAAHKEIKQRFPSVITAIEGIGSPQILSTGTIGGDLCQRPRCWYYRNGFGLFGKHGAGSLVREGENRYHAIFATEGPALFVSPSSLGPVLIALDAEITLVGPGGKTRKVEAEKFFQMPRSETERETVLAPNEIVTEIFVPSGPANNATYEVRHRHGLDWPYVTASVAFRLKDGVVSEPRVVLGHVAATPWVAGKASEVLNSGRIDEALATKCGEAAVEGARPLSGNSYKVQMVKTAVKRAVLEAAKV